jgi:hypothetical protein
MLRRLCRALLQVAFGVAAGALAIWLVVAQPSLTRNRPSPHQVDPARLRAHVEMLATTCFPRDYESVTNLDRCADYIAAQFGAAGARVACQDFTVHGRRYRNVIGRFGSETGALIIVGAHYDACGKMPAADDNASGVAALIELGVLLGRDSSPPPIELVAYSLEEPPFFGTPQMGSAVHARACAAAGRPITGMIALEMVGCFSDERGSQRYPLPICRWLYPTRGNFIGVIGRWDQGAWIGRVKRGMQGATPLSVFSIRAPQALHGIDFSDHRNYWPLGVPAVMVSDTAYFRNIYYHARYDTPEKLDYARMAQVVVAVHAAATTP